MLNRLKLWWYLQRLRSEDPFVRTQAATAIGDLGNATAVAPLIQIITGQDGKSGSMPTSEREPLLEAAARALGKLGDVRAAEGLFPLLGHHAGIVRLAAAEAIAGLGEPNWRLYVRGCSGDLSRLGQSRDERVFPVLVQAINNADVQLVIDAIEGLRAYGERSTVELLIDELARRRAAYPTYVCVQSPIYCKIAKTLGTLSDSRAIEPLLELFRDASVCDIDVCCAAVRALGSIDDQHAIEPLLTELQNVRNPEVFRHERGRLECVLAETLARLGDACGVKTLVGRLTDGDHGIRHAAAESLARLGHAKGIEALVGVLRDGRLAADLRVAAAKSLGDLEVRQGVPALVQALVDLDPYGYVHSAAAEALGRLGDRRAIQPLMERLADDDGATRCAVAKALANLGEEKWMTIIKGDDEDLVRLGKCKDARVVEPLVAALRDRSGLRREPRAAAIALGHLGDVRAVKPLAAALRDTDGQLRSAAATALGRLGDSRASAALLGALRDIDARVRSEALAALVKVADAQIVELLYQRLSHPAREARTRAARVLIELAASRPALLAGLWDKIHDRVTEPHLDRPSGHHSYTWGGSVGPSTDCVTSHHSDYDYPAYDQGIGLAFPRRPCATPQTQGGVPRRDAPQVAIVACPACRKKIRVPVHFAGRQAGCPVCDALIQLPRRLDVLLAPGALASAGKDPTILFAACPNPKCRKLVAATVKNLNHLVTCPHCQWDFTFSDECLVRGNIPYDF